MQTHATKMEDPNFPAEDESSKELYNEEDEGEEKGKQGLASASEATKDKVSHLGGVQNSINHSHKYFVELGKHAAEARWETEEKE